MEKFRDDLCSTIDWLIAEEFKRFKWHLKKIPAARLENADKMDTVDLMLRYYGKDVLKVAREVLEKIPRMDLLEKLPQITPTGEPNPVGGDGGQGKPNPVARDGGQGQMEKVKKDIFNILKELKEKDFEEFKWHLVNHRSPEDLGSIPRSDLENKNRENTVDLMEQCYGANSVQVAVKVLIEMKNNNLAEKLSKMN